MVNKKKRVLTTIVVIAILAVIPFLITFLTFRGEGAIIFVVGDPAFENYFAELSGTQKSNLEKQYFDHWANTSKKLALKYNWKVHLGFRRLPSFSTYQYENMIIFFIGHGYYDQGQYLMLSDSKWVNIQSISSQIYTDNLSVIVDSCYSVNWLKEFNNENLNNLFTSDLTNGTHHMEILYFYNRHDLTVQIYKINSYTYYYTQALLKGYNFTIANKTAFESLG